MSRIANLLKLNPRAKFLRILALIILFSFSSLRAHSEELLLQEGDYDTIACLVDDTSLNKYRARCANNFPELQSEIAQSFQSWRAKNAGVLEETSAVCREHIAMLAKYDAIRLSELQKHAQEKYAQFIARIKPASLADARLDCEALVEHLKSTNSAISDNLADKIRAVNLASDPITMNLELGSSPIVLELRLITDKDTSNSEVMTQKTIHYFGEQIENVYVQKSSLIGTSAFRSFQVDKSDEDWAAIISLSTTIEGAQRLEEATINNLGGLIALVLNQEVLFVTKIQEKIPAGSKLSFKSPRGRAKYMAQQISKALSQ